MYVNNQSLEKPQVNIKVLLGEDILVDEGFVQKDPHYLKSFKFIKRLGVYKLKVIVNDEILIKENVGIWGVKWIVIHYNDGNEVEIDKFFYKPLML